MHTLKLIQKPSHICYKNCLIPTYNNKKLKNIPLMSSNKCFSPDSEVHLVEKRWTCNRKFQMENSGLDSPQTHWEPHKAWLFVYVFCDTWGLFLEIEGGDMSIYDPFPELVFFTTAAVLGLGGSTRFFRGTGVLGQAQSVMISSSQPQSS